MGRHDGRTLGSDLVGARDVRADRRPSDWVATVPVASSPLTSRIGLMTTDIVNNIDQRLGQLQGEIVKLETARTLLLDDGTSPGAAQPRHRGDRPGAQGRGLSPPERSPPCSPALMA
jgi:hypothetical protein